MWIICGAGHRLNAEAQCSWQLAWVGSDGVIEIKRADLTVRLVDGQADLTCPKCKESHVLTAPVDSVTLSGYADPSFALAS